MAKGEKGDTIVFLVILSKSHAPIPTCVIQSFFTLWAENNPHHVTAGWFSWCQTTRTMQWLIFYYAWVSIKYWSIKRCVSVSFFFTELLNIKCQVSRLFQLERMGVLGGWNVMYCKSLFNFFILDLGTWPTRGMVILSCTTRWNSKQFFFHYLNAVVKRLKLKQRKENEMKKLLLYEPNPLGCMKHRNTLTTLNCYLRLIH